MFTKELIAPCGLNCGICNHALQKENPCPGCNGPDANKPTFCSTVCKIAACTARKSLLDSFCDLCPDFPCEDVMEKEARYTSSYPVRESPVNNLQFIRANGMEAFLKAETERWLCGTCGGVICVHNGECSGCGKQYCREK